MKTVFIGHNSLRSKICHTKPPSEKSTKTSVVYSIPCECAKQYIDETKRAVSTRIAEHRKNIFQGEFTKYKLAEHSREQNHKFNFEDFSIICTEPHDLKRTFKEPIYIRKHKAISQASGTIPEVLVFSLKPGCPVPDVNTATSS